MSAAVYTQLTDVEIEVNGLMTYDRIIKSNQAKIYKANRDLIERDGVEEEFVLPTANIKQQSWHYTLTNPGNDWYKESFWCQRTCQYDLRHTLDIFRHLASQDR